MSKKHTGMMMQKPGATPAEAERMRHEIADLKRQLTAAHKRYAPFEQARAYVEEGRQVTLTKELSIGTMMPVPTPAEIDQEIDRATKTQFNYDTHITAMQSCISEIQTLTLAEQGAKTDAAYFKTMNRLTVNHRSYILFVNTLTKAGYEIPQDEIDSWSDLHRGYVGQVGEYLLNKDWDALKRYCDEHNEELAATRRQIHWEQQQKRIDEAQRWIIGRLKPAYDRHMNKERGMLVKAANALIDELRQASHAARSVEAKALTILLNCKDDSAHYTDNLTRLFDLLKNSMRK